MRKVIIILLGLVTFAFAKSDLLENGKSSISSELRELLRFIKKGPIPDPPPELQLLRRALDAFPAIENIKGILAFASNEHVQAALDYIDGLAQAYNQELLKAANGKTDIPASQELDGQKPYAEFEAGLKFDSLRAALFQKQIEWLRANQTSDDSTDPDNYHIAEDNIRSIINPYNELSIGDKHYRFNPDGPQTYASLEELIASRPRTDSDSKGRRLQGWSCGSWRFRFGSLTTGTSRIKWTVGHYWFPWAYRAVARTCNYRRWFWIWWPAQAWTYSAVYGHVSADAWSGCSMLVEQCAAATPFNPQVRCYSYGWGFCRTHTLIVHHKTAPGWVRGRHSGIASASAISVLV